MRRVPDRRRCLPAGGMTQGAGPVLPRRLPPGDPRPGGRCSAYPRAAAAVASGSAHGDRRIVTMLALTGSLPRSAHPEVERLVGLRQRHSNPGMLERPGRTPLSANHRQQHATVQQRAGRSAPRPCRRQGEAVAVGSPSPGQPRPRRRGSRSTRHADAHGHLNGHVDRYRHADSAVHVHPAGVAVIPAFAAVQAPTEFRHAVMSF